MSSSPPGRCCKGPVRRAPVETDSPGMRERETGVSGSRLEGAARAFALRVPESRGCWLAAVGLPAAAEGGVVVCFGRYYGNGEGRGRR